MGILDRLADKFRRKQQHDAIVDTMVERQYTFGGRSQSGRGKPSTHSKRLKAARKASRR